MDLLGLGGAGIWMELKKLGAVAGRSERELGDAAKDAGRAADAVDHSKLLEGFEGSPASRRYGPGVASYGNLPRIQEGERWLRGSERNAAKVPLQVAEKLAGRTFADFNDFRRKFWMAVADEPVLAEQFAPIDLLQMKHGFAPSVEGEQNLGKRKVYELDHNIELQDGGNVYDMENIMIRTPLNHVAAKSSK